jgi:hypothetical protein
MDQKLQQFRLILIIVCSIILLSGGLNAVLMASLGEGYTTGYEGAKASFYGIEWNFKDESGKDSFTLKGTTFHFDPDEYNKGAPNLEGEMTSVFLPEGSRPSSWVNPEWWDTATEYINNPIETYEWEITEGNETTLYTMDEYKLKWYFSISAEWDKGNSLFYSEEEFYDKRYRDTKIWFEFDLEPIWYFEGADQCYFSIAKIRVSDIAFGGKLDEKREETTATDNLRVTPMSKASILPIYYNPFGVAEERAEKEPYTFQGKTLNPELFTDKVYAYFTLTDFGTHYWTELGGFVKHWKGDVITVGFDVHVFVVGTWKVQDIQEIPEEYGRTSKTGSEGLTFLEKIAEFFGSSTFKFWFLLGVIA